MKFVSFESYKISKLSLGTVQFGLNYGIANISGQPTQDEVNKIVNYVIDNGITCFDTAQAYGDSEIVLGQTIESKENIFLISKLKSEKFQNNSIENVLYSLQNLGKKSLFGLLLHDSTLLYSWKEKNSEDIKILKEKELIKYFGVSIYTSEDFDLAIKNDDITFIQIPFSVFDLRAIHEKWFERAKEKGKLIFIRSIFLQGLLLMNINEVPEKLTKAKQHLEIFEQFAFELNMSKSELALSFVETIAKNSILLFGCDTLEQAKENIKSYEEIKQLDIALVEEIIESFSSVSEDIYLPTRW